MDDVKKQGIVRISRVLLEAMLALPDGAQILDVNAQIYFDSDDVAFKIQHPALPRADVTDVLPRIEAEVRDEGAVTVLDWSKSLPGTEPVALAHRTRMAALLVRACRELMWCGGPGNSPLCRELMDAAMRLDPPKKPEVGPDGGYIIPKEIAEPAMKVLKEKRYIEGPPIDLRRFIEKCRRSGPAEPITLEVKQDDSLRVNLSPELAQTLEADAAIEAAAREALAAGFKRLDAEMSRPVEADKPIIVEPPKKD